MRSDQQAHDYARAGHSHRLMLGCGFLWLSRARIVRLPAA
jgi:hypothetical protein